MEPKIDFDTVQQQLVDYLKECCEFQELTINDESIMLQQYLADAIKTDAIDVVVQEYIAKHHTTYESHDYGCVCGDIIYPVYARSIRYKSARLKTLFDVDANDDPNVLMCKMFRSEYCEVMKQHKCAVEGIFVCDNFTIFIIKKKIAHMTFEMTVVQVTTCNAKYSNCKFLCRVTVQVESGYLRYFLSKDKRYIFFASFTECQGQGNQLIVCDITKKNINMFDGMKTLYNEQYHTYVYCDNKLYGMNIFEDCKKKVSIEEL